MTNVYDPFDKNYGPDRKGIDAPATHDLDIALRDSIAALADTGRVQVWILTERDVLLNEEDVCGVYVTLVGAINGATAITADEIVNPKGGNLNLTQYLIPDINWEWLVKEEELRIASSDYSISVTPPYGESRPFGIFPAFLLP